MAGKARFLHSVSVAATAAAAVAVSGHADAQGMPGIAKYTYDVQGGTLFAPAPDSSFLSDESEKLGEEFPGTVVEKGFGPDLGGSFAASFGVTFDNAWDARFGMSLNEFRENTGSVTGTSSFSSSFSGSSFGGTFTSSFSSSFSETFTDKKSWGFETADFEVGFSPKLGSDMGVRLFGGIRALRFHSVDDQSATYAGSRSSTYSGTYFGSSFSDSFSSGFSETSALRIEKDFFGAGPRIGASFDKRFDGSNFGVSGQVAGALIIGTETDTSQSSFSSSFSYNDNGDTGGRSSSYAGTPVRTTSTKAVIDAELETGLDYYLNDATKLTFGYKVETLTTVSGGSGPSGVAQGAFVKVSGSF